jgi:hypothetical protein
MITAFVLLLLLVIVVAVALVSGVVVVALRLALLAVKLVFQILFLPFTILGGFRRDRWRRRGGVW